MTSDDDNPGAMLRRMFCDPNDPDGWGQDERAEARLRASSRARMAALDQLARDLDLREFVARVNERDSILNTWRAAA